MMNAIAKSKKRVNFSNKEVEDLLDLVEKYRAVIENKRTDHVSNTEKMKCWEKIASEFNAENTEPRSSQQLKNKYENLKKDTKLKVAESKKLVKQTGGGPYENIIETPRDHRLLGIMGVSATGYSNQYDDDGERDADDQYGCEDIDHFIQEEEENEELFHHSVSGPSMETLKHNENYLDCNRATTSLKARINNHETPSSLNKKIQPQAPFLPNWDSYNPAKLKRGKSVVLRTQKIIVDNEEEIALDNINEKSNEPKSNRFKVRLE